MLLVVPAVMLSAGGRAARATAHFAAVRAGTGTARRAAARAAASGLTAAGRTTRATGSATGSATATSAAATRLRDGQRRGKQNREDCFLHSLSFPAFRRDCVSDNDARQCGLP